jgi:hypothetical protein
MGYDFIRATVQQQQERQDGIDSHADPLSSQDIAPSSKVQSLPWRQITRDAIGLFLATRIVYAIATYFVVVFSLSSIKHGFVTLSLGTLLRSWETGDVNNYLSIAANGYTHDFLTAFFPLYPLLIRIFTLGHAGTFELVVAMVISNLGTLAALIGLGLLAAHEYGSAFSVPVIRVLIAFPLAFFLVAGYADNLFLALAIFALFFARRSAWPGAIACTFVSALLRPTGVTLTLPLLWEYGQQQGWWSALWAAVKRRQVSWRDAARRFAPRSLRSIANPFLVVAAAPAGVALFAIYCWTTFGDPLVFLHVQETHFIRRPTPLPSALIYLLQTLHIAPLMSFLEARNLIDVAPIVIFMLLVVFAFAARQMPVTYLIYVLGVFYADLAAPLVGWDVPFPSVGRHMLLAVPVFLLLGKWSTGRPWLDTLILWLGLILQGVFLVAVMYGTLTGFNAID